MNGGTEDTEPGKGFLSELSVAWESAAAAFATSATIHLFKPAWESYSTRGEALPKLLTRRDLV
jgi:NAD dependent epimerase/dehydratase family enzyme